jgi:urea transporter
MNDDEVRRGIENIERGLIADDAAFVQRLRALWRAEIRTVITVAVLLFGGAVLVSIGVATFTWPIWAAGLLALIGSVVVDEHHRRVLGRPPLSPGG